MLIPVQIEVIGSGAFSTLNLVQWLELLNYDIRVNQKRGVGGVGGTKQKDRTFVAYALLTYNGLRSSGILNVDSIAISNIQSLLMKNQLEIVTGGWVMNDEANSHWQSTVTQLMDGHQWLKQNLNYTPVSHWCIDPFGLSLTQPYLLKEMGLKNMLIQRTHYSVKKEFASKKHLEFRWRQLWDSTGSTEILTHMMPFYSYDIPHTCGPDPKICCQFDFKRLPNHGLYCPWRVAPQVITERNIAERFFKSDFVRAHASTP
uniref:Alpha-mannosidase 2-like n=1 Tax=Diabrotica virgifera virgifera TaxID=50390 RepID=A0A6P7EZY3_DIAVI